MNMIHNQVRWEQTEKELARLQDDIAVWLQHRRARDSFFQYQSQLKTLEIALLGAVEVLRAKWRDFPVQGSSGTLYVSCRAHEKRIYSIRQVWDYYRQKFDQRDEASLKQTLAAADEVVWSCYTAPFDNAMLGTARPSTPLPYISPEFSPRAIPRTKVPPLLAAGADLDFRQSFIQKLPLPLIALPPVCVRAPWWLIFLGHEVGHHVQYDLHDQLVSGFGGWLRKHARGPDGELLKGEEAQRWQDWSLEIFADSFSLFLLGPGALWAMAELERAEPECLLGRGNPLYPPPLVRLNLMARLLADAGLKAADFLTDPQNEPWGTVPVHSEPAPVPPHWGAMAARDLLVLPSVCRAIRSYDFNGIDRFESLCGWFAEDHRSGGVIDLWREKLAQTQPSRPQRGRSAPRFILAAGLARWSNIISIENRQQRQDETDRLVSHLLPTIIASREEGTRSGVTTVQTKSVKTLAESFALSLMNLSPEALAV